MAAFSLSTIILETFSTGKHGQRLLKNSDLDPKSAVVLVVSLYNPGK